MPFSPESNRRGAQCNGQELWAATMTRFGDTMHSEPYGVGRFSMKEESGRDQYRAGGSGEHESWYDVAESQPRGHPLGRSTNSG